MSTYYYMILDVPLRVAAVDAETEIRAALSEMPWERDDWRCRTLIDDDIAFDVDLGDGVGPDGLLFRDDRLRASLSMSNITWEVGAEYVDGVEIVDTRLRASLLMDALGRVALARPGDILGAFLSEHGEAGGPVVMTDHGVRCCYSNASCTDHDHAIWSNAKGPFAIARVPPASIGIAADDRGWTCSIDRDLIRTMHADGLIEASAPEPRRIGAT